MVRSVWYPNKIQIDASSKLVSAQGSLSVDPKGNVQANASAALMNITATTKDKQSGFNSKVGYVSGEGSISESDAGGKVEAAAVSLDGKYDGKYGSVGGSAKVFSTDAEVKREILTGSNSKYGFDVKAGAQASAISGEVNGCLGTQEDFAMVCGKIGANAGPAGDIGAKVIWDNTNDILQFGVNGKIIGGVEIEGQIKF